MINSIKVIQVESGHAWDNYVGKHLNANPYHLFNWQKAINEAYGHQVFAMAAIGRHSAQSSLSQTRSMRDIIGILPLVHLQSYIFGNQLVSMPFFDHGGILSDNQVVEKKLIEAAILLGRKLKVQQIELRHLDRMSYLSTECTSGTLGKEQSGTVPYEFSFAGKTTISSPAWSLQTHKVRLLMNLPESSEVLMKSFKSKLRSQIRRPIKEGLVAKIGGIELLDDFYEVFSVNMRDLGSPVHAKGFLRQVIHKFSEAAKIVVVYCGRKPIAASIIVGFKDLMINPWASALREFSKLSANMLLYWTMLAYASDHGYRSFDFGRSTLDEGTYRFKTQWGAEAHKMYWYTIWLGNMHRSTTANEDGMQGKSRAVAEQVWRRMPVQVTKWIGPLIRKYISL